MVRLKVEIYMNIIKMYIRFNSNMVRLKAGVSKLVLVYPSLFQFQYGSIKRLVRIVLDITMDRCFNSNMVRLKDTGTCLHVFFNHCFNSNMVRLKVVAKIRFFSKNKGL